MSAEKFQALFENQQIAPMVGPYASGRGRPDQLMAEDIRAAAERSRSAAQYFLHQFVGALHMILDKHAMPESAQAIREALDMSGEIGP